MASLLLVKIIEADRSQLISKVYIEFSVLEDKKVISTGWFINWKKLHFIL